MESVHIRIHGLILARIDRWADAHSADRSTAIRALIIHGLDTDGLISTVQQAIEMKDIGLSQRQIADLGTALSYALLVGIGKPSNEITEILKFVREALLKGQSEP